MGLIEISKITLLSHCFLLITPLTSVRWNGRGHAMVWSDRGSLLLKLSVSTLYQGLDDHDLICAVLTPSFERLISGSNRVVSFDFALNINIAW